MSTYGSTLSVAATLVFVLLVGSLVSETQAPIRTNPWRISSLAQNTRTDVVAEGSQSETLEHALASPTPLHAYLTLPVLAGSLSECTFVPAKGREL